MILSKEMMERAAIEQGPLPHELEHEAREACGVYAIYGENVAQQTYFALRTLQHRGQEAAGIAVQGFGQVVVLKDTGLVSEAFEGGRKLVGLPDSSMAIGHVRYGTTDTLDPFHAAQPVIANNESAELALGHNGHIRNTNELAADYGFSEDECFSDSEVLTKAISKAWEKAGSFRDGLTEVLEKVDGAFSLVMLTNDRIVAARDRHGMRPLVLGESAGTYVVASEIPALTISGTKFIREIAPGEVVEISTEGLQSWQWTEAVEPKLCSFELIYFSRPDNVLGGEGVKSVRERMGHLLAARWPVQADVVIDVPDSGRQAALGYSHASHIPYDQGLVKNNYIGRTFIQPTQEQRTSAVRMKLNVLETVVADRSVVVVDDSVVRGTTTKAIVSMLREAGAREVHLRISSAPYQWPCFYGMDTGDPKELLAANMNVQQMNEFIGSDSLGFLAPEDIRRAAGSLAGKLCMACMTGRYPAKPLTI